MTFTVPGIPIPQARPRVMRGGWAYDPNKKDKKLVAQYAQFALQGPWRAILGPESIARLSILIKFFGARRNADLDNLYKLITDSCQGILYKNDSQIDHAAIWRHSASKGEERTEVDINVL